jgi:hypothetical protein
MPIDWRKQFSFEFSSLTYVSYALLVVALGLLGVGLRLGEGPPPFDASTIAGNDIRWAASLLGLGVGIFSAAHHKKGWIIPATLGVMLFIFIPRAISTSCR